MRTIGRWLSAPLHLFLLIVLFVGIPLVSRALLGWSEGFGYGSDLAFGSPASAMAVARPAATDFDLDTSVDLSAPTPTPSDNLRIADEPRPWLEDPPEDVPSTDEADALDEPQLEVAPVGGDLGVPGGRRRGVRVASVAAGRMSVGVGVTHG